MSDEELHRLEDELHLTQQMLRRHQDSVYHYQGAYEDSQERLQEAMTLLSTYRAITLAALDHEGVDERKVSDAG
jgi:hypothetical protein